VVALRRLVWDVLEGFGYKIVLSINFQQGKAQNKNKNAKLRYV
jgi:hypothetical protein